VQRKERIAGSEGVSGARHASRAPPAGVAAERVIRVVLTAFAIVFVPPVIDLLLSGGVGIKMSYLLPKTGDELLRMFATFCFSLRSPGASPGIRIEAAVVVLSSALYIWSKRRHLLWALVGALGVYTAIFAYGAFPFLVMSSLGPGAMTDDNLVALLFLTAFPFLLWLCSRLQPSAFRAIVRDARPERLAYYCLMLLCGFALGKSRLVTAPASGTTTTLALINGCLAIVFAGIFSAITNNIEDLPVDTVSNPGRPLPANAVSQAVYYRFAIGALALASIHGLLAGFVVYFCVCVPWDLLALLHATVPPEARVGPFEGGHCGQQPGHGVCWLLDRPWSNATYEVAHTWRI
jgi:hypothetical protein